MTIIFDNYQLFDAYARQAGWFYDNGWRYQAALWEAYRGPTLGAADYLVMLRDSQRTPTAHRTLVIHCTATKITEVWSGHIGTGAEFDKLLEYLRAYCQEYKA